MSVFKGKERWAMIVTVLLSFPVMAGCAPTFTYSFDTKTRFAERKSYTWATLSSLNQTEHLLEMNVQVLADQPACFLTQATYRSIHFCRNFLLSAPMLPASSNNPSFAWMKISG